MNDAPDLAITCPTCGRDMPMPETLDVDAWHAVECGGHAERVSEEHRFWWRRRSNPVPGEDPLLEYSEFDPRATADPETAH